MGRSPCCAEDADVKKGPWTPEEDQKLVDCINEHGHGNWRALPKLAGLNRCGKSCRLRWTNYLRPDIKRGKFTEEEEGEIIKLHAVLGNKWSRIATHLPGRTDNEIKNYWNTQIRKKLLNMGIDPQAQAQAHTHKPRTDLNHLLNLSHLLCASHPWDTAFKLAKTQLLHNLLKIINSNLASQNPYSFQGFLDGTSTLSGKQLAPTAPKPLNITENAGATATSQNPWAYNFGGDLNSEGKLGISNRSLSTSAVVQTENPLPELVSESLHQTSSPINHMDKMADAATYEAWEKLIMEDDDDCSCWKEFLDLSSST
ncbi:hypothetical protein V6N11_012579 [Hibiscus sabdariffa]|uniref:Uncharacterized protein n=1 Tax=Hibiscus sabdariffa TaxID=183260 RepID=A0ABR2QBJ4_9ROSI